MHLNIFILYDIMANFRTIIRRITEITNHLIWVLHTNDFPWLLFYS